MTKQCPHSTICLPKSDLQRVVVIGAGFAGLNLIKKLRKQAVQVVLLDKNNFHQFQPLLYQVAIAGLEPDSIVSPIRKIFQGHKNFIYRMAEVTKIEPEQQLVYTNIGFVKYDYLVIATGSSTNYFGLDQIEQNSVGLKDIRDALNIRSWILQNLEKAAVSCDVLEKDALTNFVIVGGGPAGVELAGALAEFKRYLLNKDYPEIAKEWMKIYLLEAGENLLNALSKKASSYTLHVLKKMEVEVLLHSQVKDYDGLNVSLADGTTIRSRAMIWTAGVKGAVPEGLLTTFYTANNRLKVDPFNRVFGSNNIFAIGDIAAMISTDYPQGHPMLAPVAIQQAHTLASNLRYLIKSGNLKKTFEFKDKGSLATIGMKSGVAQFGNSTWKGRIAWWLWSTVHLFSITGFKNKLMVGVNWMMRYLVYEKANRLIIRKFYPGLETEKKLSTIEDDGANQVFE